ncbi:MAG: hypothetical protein FWC82_01760 [Firmicutes bacterium]|nr:hypothetical protein [Bacillota bacterium]
MSLYYFIASDTDLMILGNSHNSKQFSLWEFDANDHYHVQMKKLFDKKYFYQFDPNYSHFGIIWHNGFEPARDSTTRYNETVLAAQQILFEKLKQILPKGEEALFYVLYGTNPVFVPINEIKINIQNFIVPFPFSFSEHILYKLQN